MSDFAEVQHRARMFVCGSKFHSVTNRWEAIPGGWHQRFRGHPWVEQSIVEGWGRALRSHLVLAVSRRMFARQEHGDINALMPDKEFVAAVQKEAMRERQGREWRAQCEAEYGSMDAYWAATKHIPRYSDFQSLKVPVAKAEEPVTLKNFIARSVKKIEPDDSDMTLTKRMTGEGSQ